jgi:hypothetical protein
MSSTSLAITVIDMNQRTEQRILSGTVLLIAGAFILCGLIGVLTENQIADSGIETGWAIDSSVDPIQRDTRLTLALLIGGVAVWSQKATKVALIVYGCVYAFLEFYTWVVASRHGAIDSSEPAVHIAGAVVLFCGIVLWLRGKSTMMISALAPAYALFEYLMWYVETNQLKDAAGVAKLAPPTLLINLLHGAHWWHVVLLVSSALMSVWLMKLLLKEKL